MATCRAQGRLWLPPRAACVLLENTTTYRSIERELDVQGATSWTGGIVNLGAGGKLINRGTFTINSNASLQLYTYQSTLSFENQGTLVKKGTGVAILGRLFWNRLPIQFFR